MNGLAGLEGDFIFGHSRNRQFLEEKGIFMKMRILKLVKILGVLSLGVFLSACELDKRGSHVFSKLGPSVTTDPDGKPSQTGPSEMEEPLVEIPGGDETATPAADTKIPRKEMTYIQIFPELSSFHGYELMVPNFNLHKKEISQVVTSALLAAQKATSIISSLDKSQITYDTTFGALDITYAELFSVINPIEVIGSTAVDKADRDVASATVVRVYEWLEEIMVDKVLYSVLLEASQNPGRELSDEELKFVRETLADFRRSGVGLDGIELEKLAALKSQLIYLSSKFAQNIRESQAAVILREDELVMVSDDVKKRWLQDGGGYLVNVNITGEFIDAEENIIVESARKKVELARDSLAKEENLPILQQMVDTRYQIARILGFGSWTDYRVEDRMAGSRKAALNFVEGLIDAFDTKFKDEVAELQVLKAQDRARFPDLVDDDEIHLWDFRYYQSILKKTKYNIDTSELRNYFEMSRVREAAFETFSNLFGLEFIQLTPPYKWVEDLEFFMVLDRETREPLGSFYLDLYPRDGKYQHFAHFGIMPGYRKADGSWRRPVSALICNFPKASSDEPSLLSPDEVGTFFHEFGHLMHSMISKVRLSRYSGTGVERDFVEAPSQVFEAWAWDQKVLDSFAQHYQDPTKKISAETLQKMKEADLATKGIWYRRQLTFAWLDLQFHGSDDVRDVEELTNEAFDKIMFAQPEGAFFAANWGHMDGYDGGYYGYAWADVIAQDMISAFKNSLGGMLDPELGLRMKEEIYEVGGSRSAYDSIRSFLGRDYNREAFDRENGLTP
ncbi:MAG: hypothetical protein COV44_04775 [Deltaproteobacteria bacterium CG11_big_fil_rev_8_21_14_0_20_45_16]|nr:MAG: hypothetical protein COV44_04775 [Deltaproteobacteria bacterium CG11_big_fil_rev_8_21_14_0_20_45_16]